MKIVFFGSDGLALPALARLVEQSWCELSLVVTPPDRPAGRKQIPAPTAVKRLAQQLSLTTADHFSNLPPADVGVVVYYGVKIPTAVINHFPLGIVNIHPSLLPLWRGPSPIKSAILAGATETGVSIMLIDQGLDTGPLLKQLPVAIEPLETAEILEQRLGQIGADLLIQTLPDYCAGAIKPYAQAVAGVSVSSFISKADGELSPQASKLELWNRYRALQPWPGVFFQQAGKRYKITAAHFIAERFIIDTIQPEGKMAMALADFKRGYPEVSFADII